MVVNNLGNVVILNNAQAPSLAFCVSESLGVGTKYMRLQDFLRDQPTSPGISRHGVTVDAYFSAGPPAVDIVFLSVVDAEAYVQEEVEQSK